MTELTLLLPELRRCAAAAAIRLWVARGDRLPDMARGRDAALRSAFEFVGTAVPAAALTRSLDANDAAGPVWVRADPCHVLADAAAVRMLAWSRLGLSEPESAELARALRPLFGDAGFPLEPATPERWYLRCPPSVRLPAFAPAGEVLGADLLAHFPRGDNERQWRHLLNEAQVILHNHPVNAQRAQRGQVTANSLWFWGAGKLPDFVRTRFAAVWSDDPIAHALAARAGVAARPAAAFAPDNAGDALLDLSLERDLDAALAPVDAALQARRAAAVVLRFESGEAIRFKRAHRWRFWRRVRSAA